MNRRTALAVVVLVVLVSSCLPILAEIQSVGIRLILPFTGIPLLLGAEIVTDMPFGGLSISLFLSPQGGTLLLGSADIALAEDLDETSASLRVTTGLSYFDPGQRFPSIVFGGGVSVLTSAAQPLAFGLTSELIYPIAFPVPMLAVSGAWSFR